MKNTPIDYPTVKNIIHKSKLGNVGKASIRQLLGLVNDLEKETGKKYIRMEMGVPGINAPKIAVEAEKNALDNNCASIYPPFDGVPELKTEISKFVKNFLGVEISALSCIPTVGSVMGSYASFMVAGRRDLGKDTVLLIDPGFPVHRQQLKMLGLKIEAFDVYDYRGKKLYDKLQSYFAKGNISTVLYSNPNNPSWICFTEEELQIIGSLATKYDVVVVEDLAYFGMDFRKNSALKYPIVQNTVAKYTENFILLISTSKSFSYAGQRVGLMIVSDVLYGRDFNGLSRFYDSSNFGYCIANGTVYSTIGGTTHSSQYGVMALLKAVNNDEYKFINIIKEYGKRAKNIKPLFTLNGFNIVYDKDIDQPIADGFFFTVSYPGYSGDELVEELLFYGISAISLGSTGSARTEGIRISVSRVDSLQWPVLNERLKKFHQNNKWKI